MSVTDCFVIHYKMQYEGYQTRGIIGVFRMDVDIKTFKNSFEKNVAVLKYDDNPYNPDSEYNPDSDEEFSCIEDFMTYYKNSMDTFEEIGYELSVLPTSGFVECYNNYYHNDNTYLTYKQLIYKVINYLRNYNRIKLKKLEKSLSVDIIDVIIEFLIGH